MVSKLVKLPLICAGAAMFNMAAISGASAVSIYLGKIAPPQVRNSFNYRVEGVDLTVTAFAENPRTSRVLNARVSRTALGLGVVRGRRDSYQVDGRGLRDTLRLTFAKTIRLVSATFSLVDGDDDVDITLDGKQVVQGDLPRSFLGFAKVRFKNKPAGSLLDVSVVDHNDNYFLKKVNVEHVPEPLTILGTGFALGTGILLERKRSKARTKVS